ncbi:MAG: glycosyltransferase family 87 protein [Chloroflexota bacterium]
MSGGGIYGLRRLREPAFLRLVVILVAGILVGYRLLQFVVFTTQIQWGYDFSAYWRAGAALLAGDPIYQAHQLAGPYAPQEQYLYLYPPPLAAAAMLFHQPWSIWNLLAPDDYRAAAWAWTLLGALVLLTTVMAIARSEGLADRIRAATGLGPWILVAAVLGFPPVVGELVLGNVHLVLLGLLGLAWLGLRGGTTRGERIAGVAIGVAAVIKVFPGVLLLWFLLTRRWQGAAFVVVGAAAATLLTLPFTGIQPWLDYPTVLANLSAPSDTRDTLAPTVWLAEVVDFTLARVLVTGAGLVLLAWAAVRRPARMSFTVAVLVSILVAPALYHHYLAILVLPFLLLLAEGRWIGWLALAYLLMSGGEQAALGDWSWILNRGFPTVGALLLLALAFVPGGRRRDIRVP